MFSKSFWHLFQLDEGIDGGLKSKTYQRKCQPENTMGIMLKPLYYSYRVNTLTEGNESSVLFTLNACLVCASKCLDQSHKLEA